MAEKKPRPSARCPNCFGVAYRMEAVGEHCVEQLHSRQHHLRRCVGRYRDALMANWEECPFCGTSGVIGGHRCSRCWGLGWLFVGPWI